MHSAIWLALVVGAIYYVFNYWRCYARNLEAARRSGIPFIWSPIYTFNRFWLVTHRLWLPLIKRLPPSWTAEYLFLLDPEWMWTSKFDAFKKIGNDIFLVCTPGHNTLFVANAEATSQIVTRRNDFPKPLKLYGSVNLFGKNVVSTEGQVWRHHRKITSPPFTESNNHLVWQESLRQGRSMLTGWIGTEGATKTRSISDVAAATMRLSLYVISKAGFGVSLVWPHEEIKQSGQVSVPPAGHTLTYKDALSTLLENIIPVMLLPRWFLSRSPFEGIKIANESYVEWGRYMREMYEIKKSEIMNGETREGMDLMGALVSGAGITANSFNSGDAGEKNSSSKQMLSDEEILGNAFVFILAGHETVANTLNFSIMFLAMNWSSQERLQRDLDEIFGDRSVDEWDYDRDVPRLFSSMAGAVINEELRMIPPVIGIPKSTPVGAPQPLTIDGKRYIVPQDSQVTLDTVATHRNPKYWPTTCRLGASEAEIEKDLDTFKPERWLQDPSKSHGPVVEAQHSEPEDDFGGPTGHDTASTMFRPSRGAYIPFSEGARSCLGRRFAQIEALAVLAVVFREYSVELALDEWASEQDIAAMNEEAKRATWEKAKYKAEDLLKHGMMSIITIQMRKGKVAMRFVKRGSESFRYY